MLPCTKASIYSLGTFSATKVTSTVSFERDFASFSLIVRKKIFDKVIIAVAKNSEKSGFLPVQDRIKLIKESTKQNPMVPQKMVEYLLGEFDFYKVISIDSKRITQIQSYNLHGTLNKSTRTINPKIKIPVVLLPTRIVGFDFKPNSSNTVELYMDGGWQFNFRIHNASTKVEQSLKFDIQIIGMPTTIISINCSWK